MMDKCTSFVWSLPSHHLTISTSDLNLRSLPLECGLMLRSSLNHRYDVLPRLCAYRMWTVTRICWVKFTSRSGKCFISLMPFFFFNLWSFFCFFFSNFPQPRKVEPEPSQGSFLTLPLLVILIVLAVNHNKVRKTGTVYVFIVMMRWKPGIYRLPRVYFLL